MTATIHRAIIRDLLSGRRLWGPIGTAFTGDLREPNGDSVRGVTGATISNMVRDRLIEPHPTIPNRYVLTERALYIALGADASRAQPGEGDGDPGRRRAEAHEPRRPSREDEP